MSITWNDLFTQGTLIDYSVHLWRARIRLTAEDLGIDATDDVQKAFSFGCHRLAPTKSFEEINSAVNAWMKDIEDHSFDFPLLRGVRYVPDTQVPELQRKLDERKREFNIAVDEFLDRYNTMMQEVLPTIEQALHDAAKTSEAAKSAFSRVVQEYPSVSKVAKKFDLEWNFFTISIPISKEAAVTAKSAIPQVQSVITSMIDQLRSELSDKVGNLLTLTQNIKDGKSRSKAGLASKSKKSALAVLDRVDRLNIMNDDTLTEQVSMLRLLLSNDNDLSTTVRGLKSVKSNLEADISAVVEAAEKRMTGLGNRKISI